jgi:hypothetical protein
MGEAHDSIRNSPAPHPSARGSDDRIMILIVVICVVSHVGLLTAGKDLMPLFFQRSKRKIKTIIEALFDLLQKSVEPIRHGRQYTRKHRVLYRKSASFK